MYKSKIEFLKITMIHQYQVELQERERERERETDKNKKFVENNNRRKSKN